MAKPSAKIPLRVEDRDAKEAILAFKRSMEKSLTEVNQALEISKKVYEVSAKAVRVIADELDRSVKAALRFEGAASKFGRRLADGQKAIEGLETAIGQTITKSKDWDAFLGTGIQFAETMTKFFKSSDAQEWVDTLARGVAGAMAGLINAILGARTLWNDTFGGGSTRESITSTLEGVRRTLEVQRSTDRKGTNRIAIAHLESQIADLEARLANFDRSDARIQAIQNFADQLTSISVGKPLALAAPKSRVAIGTKETKQRTLDEAIARLDKLPGAGDSEVLAEDERREAERRKQREDDLRSLREQELAALDAAKRRELEVERSGNEAIYAEREQAFAEREAQNAAFVEQLRSFSSDLLTGGVAAAAAAAGAGENVLEALGKFAGASLQTVGQMLFNLGLGAATGGALGTVVPFLAPLTGGPAGVAAGILAMGAGGAIIAAGAALAGSSATSTSSSVGTYAGASLGGPSSDPYQIGGGPSVVSSRTYNVFLGASAIVGSPSEAGRQIKTYLVAAERRGY